MVQWPASLIVYLGDGPINRDNLWFGYPIFTQEGAGYPIQSIINHNLTYLIELLNTKNNYTNENKFGSLIEQFKHENNIELNNKKYLFMLWPRTTLSMIDFVKQSLSGDFIPTKRNKNIKKHFEDDDIVEKAVFRGSNTGSSQLQPHSYEFDCRANVVKLSNYFPQLIDARFTNTLNLPEYLTNGTYIWKSNINFSTRDADNVSNQMIYYTKERMSDDESMNYKYIIVCDGNSIADRLPRQMLFGTSVIIKQVSHLQSFWYYKLSQWNNYIPFYDCNQLIMLLRQIQSSKSSVKNQWNHKLDTIRKNGQKTIQQVFQPDFILDNALQAIILYQNLFDIVV